MGLAITMGDACGVGPEIALRTFAQGMWPADATLIGDAGVLQRCASALDLSDRLIDALAAHDMALVDADALTVGQLSRESGEAALAYVEFATREALAGRVDGIVTLPMNKEATRLSSPDFTGHTGFIAGLCGVDEYAMMLASAELLVTHVSTHVSLREAVDRVTSERVRRVIDLTSDAVAKLGRCGLIGVLGLNPHAGERGAFGREEIDAIAPAVEAATSDGLEVVGPLPPDTVFASARAGRYSAVVCMYHDQGHIPMKLVAFEDAVNVTLGLPIVRTSVDHGTAFDIAWQGIASTESFTNACAMARQLTP